MQGWQRHTSTCPQPEVRPDRPYLLVTLQNFGLVRELELKHTWCGNGSAALPPVLDNRCPSAAPARPAKACAWGRAVHVASLGLILAQQPAACALQVGVLVALRLVAHLAQPVCGVPARHLSLAQGAQQPEWLVLQQSTAASALQVGGFVALRLVALLVQPVCGVPAQHSESA